MKTTSMHFNEKGLVKEVRAIELHNDKKDDPEFGERPKPERGNITFEPPPDDIEELSIEPPELTMEDRLENLEKKQDQIIRMVHRLFSAFPEFASYISIEQAAERYDTDVRSIRCSIRLFRRVNSRPMEMKRFLNEELYKEEELVQAMLLDESTKMKLL